MESKDGVRSLEAAMELKVDEEMRFKFETANGLPKRTVKALKPNQTPQSKLQKTYVSKLVSKWLQCMTIKLPSLAEKT